MDFSDKPLPDLYKFIYEKALEIAPVSENKPSEAKLRRSIQISALRASMLPDLSEQRKSLNDQIYEWNLDLNKNESEGFPIGIRHVRFNDAYNPTFVELARALEAEDLDRPPGPSKETIKILQWRIANCPEYSELVTYMLLMVNELKDKKIPIEIVITESFDHYMVVVNRDTSCDITSLAKWGKDCWIIDPWRNQCISSVEINDFLKEWAASLSSEWNDRFLQDWSNSLEVKWESHIGYARDALIGEQEESIFNEGLENLRKNNGENITFAYSEQDDLTINEFKEAVATENIANIETYIEQGVKAIVIKKVGKKALVEAAKNGKYDVVKFWIKNGVEPEYTKTGSKALEKAVVHNHIPIVSLLLTEGAEITERAMKLARPGSEIAALLGVPTPQDEPRIPASFNVLLNKRKADYSVDQNNKRKLQKYEEECSKSIG